MAWVKLTNTNNLPIWVNLDSFHVMSNTGSHDNPCTTLRIGTGTNGSTPGDLNSSFVVQVRETPEQILLLAQPVL